MGLQSHARMPILLYIYIYIYIYIYKRTMIKLNNNLNIIFNILFIMHCNDNLKKKLKKID
jgi:hypothetical protein